MTYDILLSSDAKEFYSVLDEKSQRIVKENLQKLADEPYPRPDAGRGDREKLVVDGEEMYRLHIGRSYTAFYVILDDKEEVRVTEILPIDEAHKRYGF